MDLRLYRSFPRLRGIQHGKTSDRDLRYNCVAHAAGEDARWWEPIQHRGLLPPGGKLYWWPPDLPRGDYSIANYINAFRDIGYTLCENGNLEAGYDKIAIYALGDRAQHAARQLPNGEWSSKLGEDEDISHATLDALVSPGYGTVVAFMRRPILAGG